MQYTIKPFAALTNIELYNILTLRQAIFIIEQTCIYSDLDHKDENAYHLMAFDGETLIGYLRILEKGIIFDEVSIGRVLISESHRGRGIAKEMMGQALNFIHSKWKEAHVKLSAQTYAIPLYEGVGFQIVSVEYLEDGIPHVDMECKLTPA